MTKHNKEGTLDQAFLTAYSRQRRDSHPPTSTPLNPKNLRRSEVRVVVSRSVDVARASFDPVSSAQDAATRVLNQTARLGYKVPHRSTR